MSYDKNNSYKENPLPKKKKDLSELLSQKNTEQVEDYNRRCYNAESLGIPHEDVPDMDGDEC